MMPAVGATITNEHLVRRRFYGFRSLADLVRMLQALREERVTGQIVLNVSQGTCSSACVEYRVRGEAFDSKAG